MHDDVPTTAQIPRATIRAGIAAGRAGTAAGPVPAPPPADAPARRGLRPAPPEASGGGRLSWRDLPADLRAEIDAINGATVVHENVASSGFSPGLASVVTLSDGRRMFIKAASVVAEPFAAELHRAEAETAVRLPEGVPTPEFLWTYSDDDWIVLAFEAVDGRHPGLPWGRYGLARVLSAIDELARVEGARDLQLRPTGPDLASMCTGWASLAEFPDDRLADVVPWAVDNLESLCELEQGVLVASEGEALVHGDLRADNMLLSHGDVYLLDWPYASRGAPWLDLALFLPSVGMQGILDELDPIDAPATADERWATGSELARIFSSHPLGGTVHPEDLRSVVAGVAGYLVSSSLQPAPASIPNLRAFQRAQGVAATAWIERLGF
ncbi:phosphotransferase family enzyme [Sediminihabitans luteus]|uniref:Phosphotransferase family enzyme n=1 Tax=Sediminihabitans luteus TaxID=1138585 RepID=A0A2M9CE17_9CELL|nr:phosphotransferase [Sediminihabitans luteus]PJJ70100.1 phosphotransferase family enzyme [Sediminihabitans luteus]GIJ00116.1 hypothetical protein Slu03_24930 [Sediminihabitans luteus]